MCLIAYVPGDKRLPIANIDAAYAGNDDGIGIMSAAFGIEKFLGRKALKRAKRHIRQLEVGNHTYAIHFRYATHGAVNLANCHPFTTANRNAFVMHNGVMSEYGKLTEGNESDTAAFVRLRLNDVSADYSQDYWNAVSGHIGTGNKLCVLLADGTFVIVNEEMGETIDGIWYSQTYSLPGGYGSKYAKWDTAYASGGIYSDKWTKWGREESVYNGGYGSLVEAALERRYGPIERDSTGPWDSWKSQHEIEDEQLDAALKDHLANEPDEHEGIVDENEWYLCKSCEGLIHMPKCIYCGYNHDSPADDDEGDDTECLLPNWAMVPRSAS